MEKSPRVGKISEPFAELTKMGWEMMSPGREGDAVFALYTQTSVIMKNCVLLISWVYKKAITIMMNLCLRNSKSNWIEANRTGMRQGLFGGKTKYPWEMTNLGV